MCIRDRLSGGQNFLDIEDVIVPVHTPLCNIYRQCGEGRGFFEDFLAGFTNDRNTDLRSAFADGNVSYFYSIHSVFLS